MCMYYLKVLNSIYVIWIGKLKLCREERERIIREKNTESTVINEERKHFSSSAHQGSAHQGKTFNNGCFLDLQVTCLQIFQVDLMLGFLTNSCFSFL